MNDNSYFSDDEYIEDSQFETLPKFQISKTKTTVSKDYEKKMRSLLLNKSKKPNSIEKLRNVLLNKAPLEEDDDVDDYIDDSQNEPISNNSMAISHTNTSDPITQKKNDEYLQYLADYYTKDVTSQDKDIIGGHMLRKRNLNQLHIYELDRLNYERITAKLADARYEQSEHEDEFDDQDSLYSSKSIDESQVYEFEDSFQNNEMDFFNSLDHTTEKSMLNNKISKDVSVFEDSDDSDIIELSSDSDDYLEEKEQTEEERILPNKKRTILNTNNTKKKLKNHDKFNVNINKKNQWGKLKKSRIDYEDVNHYASFNVNDLSSSDSDDGLDDFLKDFERNVTISSKQNNNDRKIFPKVVKQPGKGRTIINKGVEEKNANKNDTKINRKYKKKNTNTLDNFFQAHLEVVATTYDDYIDHDIMEENLNKKETPTEINEKYSNKDGISAYFVKRHKDVSKQTSQYKLKTSDIYKKLMNFCATDNAKSENIVLKITNNELKEFKSFLLSAEANYDFTIFLNYLNTSPDVDVLAITNFFEEVAVEARPVLVILGNKETNKQMTFVFYKTVCIPLLGFHSLITNNHLNSYKKDCISKMSNFIVRSLNNLFKIQNSYGSSADYYDQFTKHLLIKTLSNYKNEYNKIVQYYSKKGPNFTKYAYPTLFKDLRIAVDVKTCSDIINYIVDTNIKKIFLSTCLLSYDEDKISKHELMECLKIFNENIYKELDADCKADENFIFSLRSSYKVNLKFFNNNGTLLLFRVLLKYRIFFTEDLILNDELLTLFKPKYKGKEDSFNQRIQKINMCSVLCCLNVNNFISLIDSFLRLINTKDLEKHHLQTCYKKPNIRNEILKDAFDQCLILHNEMRHLASEEWNRNFYTNISEGLWDSFYNLEWNLLGEKLVNKYSIELFVEFIKKLYFRNKVEMITPIKQILKKSIDIDDTVSLIYQFCIKTVLDDPSVSPHFIKANIFAKLFMFFKVCDSVNTYSKVIEKTQNILHNEVLDYKGYRTFFKKTSDEISPIDFYYSISSIKITTDSIISAGLKIKVFTFVKFIIVKWMKNVSYLKQKDSESSFELSYTDKFIEILKNYILMTKNLLLMTSTAVETIQALFVECNFNDFVELIDEIKLLSGQEETTQLQRLFNDIDLPYNKSSYSYFVDLLIKHSIKEKKHVLNEYLNGIKTSENLSKYINEICQNEIGFENLILYLLRHDIHTFGQVYRTLKMPQALLRVERTLIKFLKDKCLNITIDQWDIITDLPSNNQDFISIKNVMVKYTKKENKVLLIGLD